jgi:hypothetical protein
MFELTFMASDRHLFENNRTGKKAPGEQVKAGVFLLQPRPYPPLAVKNII